MAMRIKLLKSKFSMVIKDIKISQAVSLASAMELEDGTGFLMHHQISNSLVINRCFKAGCFNNSLDYNLMDFYRQVDSMKISLSHFSFKDAMFLLKYLDLDIDVHKDFLGSTFY